MDMSVPHYIRDPYAAEDCAANWLQRWGYPAARLTAGGADGGIDVFGSGAAAQVKFEGGQVGRPAIQRLVGAAGHRAPDLYFFSAAGYSRQAVEYADQLGVRLFTYSPIGDVTAANRTADDFIAGLEQERELQMSPETTNGRAVLCAFLLVVAGIVTLATLGWIYHVVSILSGGPGNGEWAAWHGVIVIPVLLASWAAYAFAQWGTKDAAGRTGATGQNFDEADTA